MPKVQPTNTMATKSNSNNFSVKSSSAEKKDEMLAFTSSSLTSVTTSTPSPLQFPERDPTKVATDRNNNNNNNKNKSTRISVSVNGEGNANNSANSEATSSSSLHSPSLVINTTLEISKSNEVAQGNTKKADAQVTQVKANDPLNKLSSEQSRQAQQRSTTTRPPHSFHHQKKEEQEQEEEEEKEDEEVSSSEATSSSEQPTSAQVVTPEPGWDALTDRRFCIPLIHPSLTPLANQSESTNINNNNNNSFNMMPTSRDINVNSVERNMVQALNPPSVGRRIKINNYMNDKPSDIGLAKHNQKGPQMSEGNASQNKNCKEVNDSQINNHNEGDAESGEWAVYENVPRIEVHEEASMINAIGSAYTSSGYPTIVSVGANRGSIYGCFVDLRNPQISSINFPPPHTVIVLPSSTSIDGAKTTTNQNKYNNNNDSSPVHSYSQQRQHEHHSFTHDNDDSEEEEEEEESEEEEDDNEDEDDINHVIHTKMDSLMHITWKRGTRLYDLNSANRNSEESSRAAFTTTTTTTTTFTSSLSPNRNANNANMPRPAANPTPVLSYINQYPDGIHGVASSPLLEKIILRGELPYDHVEQTQRNNKTTNDTQSEAGKTETKPSSINVPSSCLEPNANTPPPPKVPHSALPIQHTLLAVSTFNHLTLFFVAHQDGEMIYSAPMQTLSASINNRKVTAHCLTMTGWEEMTMMSESVPDYYKVKTFVHEKPTCEGNSAENASTATTFTASVGEVAKSISGNYNNMNSEGGNLVTESGSYKKNFALPSQKQQQQHHKSLGKRPPLVFEYLSLSNDHESKHKDNINYTRNKAFSNNTTTTNNKIVGPEDNDLYSLFGMPGNTSFQHGPHTNKLYSEQHVHNHVDQTSENLHQDRHSLHHHRLKNKSFDSAFVLEHESATALAATTQNYNFNSTNKNKDNNSSFNLERLRAAKVSFVLEPLLIIGNQNGDLLIFDVFEGKVVLRLNYNNLVSSNNTNNNNMTTNSSSNTTYGASSTINANPINTNAAPLQGSGSYSSFHHAQTIYGNTSVGTSNNNNNSINPNNTSVTAAGANLQNHYKVITSPVSVIVEVQNGLERKLSSMVQSAMLAKRQNKVEFEVNEEVYQSSSTYSIPHETSVSYPVNYATLYPSLYLAGFDNGQALLFCINLESAWMLRVFDNNMFGLHSISSIVPRVPDFYLRLWAAYIPPLPSNYASDDGNKNKKINSTGTTTTTTTTTNITKQETNVYTREGSTSASANKVDNWQHESVESSNRSNEQHEEESLEELEEEELLEEEEELEELENVNQILSSTRKTLFVSAKNLFVFDSDAHMAAVACNNGSICLIALPDIKVLCALSAYEYHSVGNVISLRWAANHPFHLLTPDLLIAAAEDDSVTAFQVHTCYIANNNNNNNNTNVYNGGSNSHTANMNINSHGIFSHSHLLCEDEREFNNLHFHQFSSGSLQVQRSQTAITTNTFNNIGGAGGANIASKMHVILRVLEKKVFHRSWVSHLSVLPLIKQAKSFHSHHWHFPCYLGTCVVATSYDGRTSFWPLLFSNNTNNDAHTSLQVSRGLEAQYNSTDSKTHTNSQLHNNTNMNGKEVTQDEYVFSPIPEHDFLTPTFPQQQQRQMSFFSELTPDGSVSEHTNHNGSENGSNSIHHAALTTSTLSINHLPQHQQQHVRDYKATRINPYLLINGPTVAPRLSREQIVCAGIAGSGTSYFLITVCCRGRVKLWSLNLKNGSKD